MTISVPETITSKVSKMESTRIVRDLLSIFPGAPMTKHTNRIRNPAVSKDRRHREARFRFRCHRAVLARKPLRFVHHARGKGESDRGTSCFKMVCRYLGGIARERERRRLQT